MDIAQRLKEVSEDMAKLGGMFLTIQRMAYLVADLAATVERQQREINSLTEVTKHLHQQIAALKARANLAQEAQL